MRRFVAVGHDDTEFSAPSQPLSYSQLAPGEPTISPRSDGLPGVEIDIPPQNERWRTYWPPRSVGAAIAALFAAVGALAPLGVMGWMWFRYRDRGQIPFIMIFVFVQFFFFAGVAWFLVETGKRRTTILAGPDGITLTTVGGMAWPHPKHWPKARIRQLVINSSVWRRNEEPTISLRLNDDAVDEDLSAPMLTLPLAEQIKIGEAIRAALQLEQTEEQPTA